MQLINEEGFMEWQYSLVLALLATFIFDFFVSSGSVMPFRFIYNIAFIMIVFVVVHTSVLLLRNKEIARNNFVLVLPMLSFLLPIMIIINLKAVFSILWLEIPDIGFLNSDILIQGISGLLPLLDYLVINIVNGILFYVIVNRKSDTYAYEIPIYVLGIIAIETSLAIYCFHVGGIDGIRSGLSLFHIGICGVVIWSYHKLKIEEINIKISFYDILLILLSVGIFMMVYIPYGIYSLFGDNAVVVGSALSITRRGSLQPYYVADVYYSPIGGFVSIVFAYLCGLENILLASTLPFLIAHVMLPYVSYHFLREFVTDDMRMAIIGTVIALLMDGLAVILLPTYAGNLTTDVINWRISPATKSLHSSSIIWIWMTPYKNMGIVSATAICTLLNRRRITGLLLGGAFLGFSFINPRQPFAVALILVFLFGIKKLYLKEIITMFLATLVFLGPILPVTFFKTSNYVLFWIGLTAEETLMQTIYAYASLLIFPILLISLVAIVFLIRLTSKSISCIQKSTEEYMPKKHTKIIISEKPCDKHFSLTCDKHFSATFLAMSIITLVYIILYAYDYTPALETSPLNYIILRYHILLVLTIIGFFGFKRNPRILITLTTLVLLTYSASVIYEGNIINNIAPPLIFVVMALPTFSTFVNFRKKLMVSAVLLFVLLGVFSAPLYSATVKTTKSEPIYADLPPMLHILLNENPKEEVFSPSYYNYFTWRMVGMANLRLTSDPSCRLYIIHKPYTKNKIIENLLNDSNIKVMYNGDAFMLLEKRSDRG